MAQRVDLSDEAPERMAEQDDLLVAQMGAQPIGIIGPAFHRDALEARRSVGASIAQQIIKNKLGLIAQRVHPGAQVGVIEASTSVYQQEWASVTMRVVEDAVAIDGRVHRVVPPSRSTVLPVVLST